MKRRFFVVIAAAALLGACAAVPLAPRALEPFDLVGRMLVTYSSGALTANARWEHALEQDQIWLMTPTGQTVAYIVDTPEGATLTSADRKQYRAGSVEALTRQALGWALPLALMQYWVKGEAAPSSAPQGVERGPDNRPTALSQNGWRVGLAYYEDGPFAGKVRRLDLNDGGNEIRLVVDNWRDAQQ